MVYLHNGVVFSHEEENYVICKKVDGTGEDPLSEMRLSYHVFSHVETRGKKIDVLNRRESINVVEGKGEGEGKES